MAIFKTIPAQTTYLLQTNGTRATPNLITAVGGISILGVRREKQFVSGSGAPVTVTANPRIQAGTIVGQELFLVGRDSTNTITLQDGNGLELNGTCVLKAQSQLALQWDGTVWGEVARNDV